MTDTIIDEELSPLDKALKELADLRARHLTELEILEYVRGMADGDEIYYYMQKLKDQLAQHEMAEFQKHRRLLPCDILAYHYGDFTIAWNEYLVTREHRVRKNLA